jgi:hypothetical protein
MAAMFGRCVVWEENEWCAALTESQREKLIELAERKFLRK